MFLVLRGCHALMLLEDAVEVFAAVEAAVVGDGLAAPFGVRQQHALGLVDAQGRHPAAERLIALGLHPCRQLVARDAHLCRCHGAGDARRAMSATGRPLLHGLRRLLVCGPVRLLRPFLCTRYNTLMRIIMARPIAETPMLPIVSVHAFFHF